MLQLFAAAEQADAGVVASTKHHDPDNVSSISEGMEAIASAIHRLAERDDVALIFPVHLNPNVRQVMNAEIGDLALRACISALGQHNLCHGAFSSALSLTAS